MRDQQQLEYEASLAADQVGPRREDRSSSLPRRAHAAQPRCCPASGARGHRRRSLPRRMTPGGRAGEGGAGAGSRARGASGGAGRGAPAGGVRGAGGAAAGPCRGRRRGGAARRAARARAWGAGRVRARAAVPVIGARAAPLRRERGHGAGRGVRAGGGGAGPCGAGATGRARRRPRCRGGACDVAGTPPPPPPYCCPSPCPYCTLPLWTTAMRARPRGTKYLKDNYKHTTFHYISGALRRHRGGRGGRAGRLTRRRRAPRGRRSRSGGSA